jgi:hypothetical protein
MCCCCRCCRYEQTRAASKPRSVREEIAYRKAANAAANGGRERKDLYTGVCSWWWSTHTTPPTPTLRVLSCTCSSLLLLLLQTTGMGVSTRAAPSTSSLSSWWCQCSSQQQVGQECISLGRLLPVPWAEQLPKQWPTSCVVLRATAGGSLGVGGQKLIENPQAKSERCEPLKSCRSARIADCPGFGGRF